MMQGVSRRTFLPLLTLPVLCRATQTGIGLNIGTYGMKSLAILDALKNIADIGYDGVELALMPGWPTNPATLSTADRHEIRRILDDKGLALPSLMESLSMDGSEKSRQHHKERLNLAIDLAHELSPDSPPVIETVIGGKTAEWERVKDSMAAEMNDWATLAEKGNIIICFKPHADQAIDIPERALWMLRQAPGTHIRIVYDYSHYIVQGLSLEESLRQLLRYTAYIAVKDAAGDRSQHRFLLPGDGQIDYVPYLRLLKQLGYRGFVGVEVTSQIHSKPGYDPVATAKLCYNRMASAFEKAGVERPKPVR